MPFGFIAPKTLNYLKPDEGVVHTKFDISVFILPVSAQNINSDFVLHDFIEKYIMKKKFKQ